MLGNHVEAKALLHSCPGGVILLYMVAAAVVSRALVEECNRPVTSADAKRRAAELFVMCAWEDRVKIEHVAIWCTDLEATKDFYETYFGAEAGSKYVNQESRFESYFLSFSSGARLELMHSPEVMDLSDSSRFRPGYAHLAVSVGSEAEVERLTTQMSTAGYQIASPPRLTGDGYFESVVLDPDSNTIEITI
jgi:lactoylglutathione lyase